jgi:DNA-binding winged helix-turn-helix (wHTH) protein
MAPGRIAAPNARTRLTLKEWQNVTTGNDTGGLLARDDDRGYPAALGQTLKPDDDHVVLVPRGEWDQIQASGVGPTSASAPAVVLPFSWKELAARFSELVRDSGTWAGTQVFRFGDICVDFARMKVTRSSGESIALTSQEFKTLKCFLMNPDRVISRDELLTEAWGYESYPSTRTVDNHVLKLRKKLEPDPTRPVHFRTVHGMGYRFVP